jgi:proteic killer suppression protein
MIVIFEETYLQELYETGKTTNKKHRFQPEIVKRYRRCIDILHDANDIETLMQINSLNYEVLKGNKQGISSIRVSDKYRVEFTVKNEIEPKIIICNILELSNHYK